MVASGMPPGRLRRQTPHQRRQTRQGRRRRDPSHHAGPPVRALPDPARIHLSSRPHPHSPLPRPERSRQGQMESHHLGRGSRHHRGEGQLCEGELGAGISGRLAGHGSRVHPVRLRHGLRLPGHPQPVLPAERPGLLRPALHRRRLPFGRGLSRARLRGVLPRSLRRPALRGAQVHHPVGQGPAVLESRRILRARHHRPHEARHQAHHHRPARHLAGRESRIPSAAAPRHRRRRGSRPAPCRDRRRPLRSRIR